MSWRDAPLVEGGWRSAPLVDEEPKQDRNALIDSGNAVGTGFHRGLARLAGLPVDTVANVIDLGKAAIGAPYIAATGKAPPKWLEPTDRSKVVGSGDYLLSKLRGTEAGRFMVDPSNPEYEGGYLQTMGGGMSGAVGGPASAGQVATRSVLGALSTSAGKAAFDATGSVPLAIAASMLPTGAAQGAEFALKHGVRGGEAGRRDMEQRVADLKAAGIEHPTLGLASGNRTIGGVENLLQSTPGAIGVMGKAREQAIAALQAKAEQAAAMASPNRGARQAGQQVQEGIEAFRDRFRARQGELYSALDQQIPAQTPTQVPATTAALSRLTAPIPGAPALSGVMQNPRLQRLAEALQSDAAGGTLPYGAVKSTRSMVGEELSGNPLVSDVPRGQWKQVYGGLSQDLRGAAAQAGPDAQRAFSRANDYTRAGMERLDTLRSFANKNTPEQAFTALANTSKENVSLLQSVKKSLPQQARGSVAGTIIDRLGRATPGQQNDMSDAFSPERFLTNWSRMSPEARRELFSGFKNSDQVRADVEAVARAASMMRDNSRLWSNPSGTAAALTARGALAGGGLGYLFDPMVPLAVGGSMGLARGAGGLLTSDRVRNLAMRPDAAPSLLGMTGFRADVGGGLLDLMQQQRERGLLDVLGDEPR